MKIELPLENWTDVSVCVPRLLLAELVAQIGDWHFSTIAQYFLHEFTKNITLGKLCIKQSRNGNGLVVVKMDEEQDPEVELPLADVPMPKNISNFVGLNIRSFDNAVLEFLKEFQRNGLFEHIILVFKHDSAALLAFLTNVLPMITSFDFIDVIGTDIVDLFQNELAIRMLESTRFLFIKYKSCDNEWFWRWVNTPTEDGKPRVLAIFGLTGVNRPIFSLIEHVMKEFAKATQAVTFIIDFHFFGDADTVESGHMHNTQTNEILVIEEEDEASEVVRIYRHPEGATNEWLNEMAEYPDLTCRKITIDI